MVAGLINPNPVVYERKERRVQTPRLDMDEYALEPIDALEIYDYLRDIKDSEYPYSLEDLKVVSEDAIEVDDLKSYVSMATIIGLCVRVKLVRSLPARCKKVFLLRRGKLCFWFYNSLSVDIRLAPGSHTTDNAVNKQLNDRKICCSLGKSSSFRYGR